MGFLTSCRASWRFVVVICTPLLLSPLIFQSGTSESKCAFVLILCAVYYITEAFPLPITSLLPLALSPLLGIMSSKDVCKFIFGDITFLILGGVLVAIAIEESCLHKRLALKILLMIGTQPRRLLMTMMACTAFMSMWISNTASFTMMNPITRAVLRTMFDARKDLPSGGGKKIGRRPRLHHVDTGQVELQIRFSTGGKKQLTEDGDDRITVETEDVTSEERKRLLVGADERKVTDDNADDIYRRKKDTNWGGFNDNDNKTETSKEDYEKEMMIVTEANDDDDEGEAKEREKEKNEVEEEGKEEKETMSFAHYDEESRRIVRMFGLAVCYAANIGGIGTLIGSPPNLVVAWMAQQLTKDGSSPITFVTWSAFGLPVVVLSLVVCCLWMCVAAFGFRNTFCCHRLSSEEENRLMRQRIEQSYRKLGPLKFSEKVVLVHFISLVLLWLTRKIGSSPGWAILFKDGYASDGMAAITVCISLFIVPRERPNVLFFRRKGDTSPSKSIPSVLTWKTVAHRNPWGVLFLIGGGMVLATTSKVALWSPRGLVLLGLFCFVVETGLSAVLADNLSFLASFPAWLATLLLTVLTVFATEIMANTVVTLLVMPVVSQMAITAGINPLLYMVPVGVTASFAFMLPVATVPNALLYAFGDVSTTDFMKTGFVMNILGIIVSSLTLNTLGYAVFSLGEFPTWLNGTGDAISDVTGTLMATSSLPALYINSSEFAVSAINVTLGELL